MIHIDDTEAELRTIRTAIQEQRHKKMSNLLRGPYICPRCKKDHFFGKTTTKRTETGTFNTYSFICRYKPCGFSAIETGFGMDTIIDGYNRLIDREEELMKNE